jgi:GTP cyclohydrolase IA
VHREERQKKLEPLLKKVIQLLDDCPNREGLVATPRRWAESLVTSTAGIDSDPAKILSTLFTLDGKDSILTHDDMVLMTNIEFTSTCEHHIAPMRGFVHIAYVPNAKKEVLGLSKLPRIVDVFAKRLQMQERLTQQIAQALDDYIAPLGVMVVIQAIHYCMIQRGVKQHENTTLTTARRGLFLENPELEIKFQSYLKMQLDNQPRN